MLAVLAIVFLIWLVFGYFAYGRWIAKQFKLDDSRETPANKVNDGEDFVPTTMNLDIVDEIIRVDDKDCFLLTRALVERAHAAGEAAFLGDWPTARAEAEAALALGPSAAAAATAHAVLARCALAHGDLDGAIHHAAAVPPADTTWEWAQAVGELSTLARATTSDRGTGGMAGRFADGIAQVIGGDVEPGLEALLALVADDKRWNDEAARKAMLVVFRMIGLRSETSDAFRRRLSMVL